VLRHGAVIDSATGRIVGRTYDRRSGDIFALIETRSLYLLRCDRTGFAVVPKSRRVRRNGQDSLMPMILSAGSPPTSYSGCRSA